MIDGKPVLIINKGKLCYKEMIKQRYSIDDLLLELRNKSVKNIKDVQYAILENNGNLNIYEYNKFFSKNFRRQEVARLKVLSSYGAGCIGHISKNPGSQR